ncbi:hypothetical protein C7B61_22430, partial [filamentous cyanobacterium CCP1]
IVNLNDIQLISSATLKEDFWSYGYRVILSLLQKEFLLGRISFLKVGLVVLCLALLLLSSKRGMRFLHWALPPGSAKVDVEEGVIDAFRVGAMIYIGTFLLFGNNWAYRLIFLIFTIPQILFWIKTESSLSRLSTLTLFSIILTMWIKMIGNWEPSRWERVVMYFDQFNNWVLLFFLTYMLFVTLPRWIFPQQVVQKKNESSSSSLNSSIEVKNHS